MLASNFVFRAAEIVMKSFALKNIKVEHRPKLIRHISYIALRCQSRRKNCCMTRCFLCQVLPLNIDRKLAHEVKMGSNASHGLGNEY